MHDGGVWRETGYLKEPQGLGQSAHLLLQGEDAGDHLRLLVGLLLQVHGAPSPLLGETQHFKYVAIFLFFFFKKRVQTLNLDDKRGADPGTCVKLGSSDPLAAHCGVRFMSRCVSAATCA